MYAYNFLYNRHHGIPNKPSCDYDDFNKIYLPLQPKIIEKQAPIYIQELIDYQFTRVLELPRIGRHHWANDIRFFQNYRTILQENMLPANLNQSNYDITIHVRTDDFGGGNAYIHKGYTPLPLSYYKKCLDDILLRKKKPSVLLISKKPHDSFTKIIFDVPYKLCLEYEKNGLISKVLVQHSTEQEDFKTLLKSNIVVMSISTYCMWGTFLSPFCKEVYVPGWGLAVDMWEKRDDILNGLEGAGNMNLDKWKSTENTKIIIYPLEIPKINMDNKSLLYN